MKNDISILNEFTHRDDIARVKVMHRELVDKKQDRLESEFRMKHKDGHYISILSRARAFFNEKTGMAIVVGTPTDITHQKMAEEELEEKNRELVRYYDAFVERELRIKDLYDENLELEKKIEEFN